MKHEPPQGHITVSDAVHEFWDMIQCIFFNKKSFFQIIQHLPLRIKNYNLKSTLEEKMEEIT